MSQNKDVLSRRAAMVALPLTVAGASLAAPTIAEQFGPDPIFAAIVSNAARAGAEPDAALLALGVQFEPIFAEWFSLENKSSEDQRKFEEFVERQTGVKYHDRAEDDVPGYGKARDDLLAEWHSDDARTEDEKEGAWNRLHARMFPLIDEILSHVAVTREGLALQVRAFVMAEDEVWRGFVYGSEPDDTRIARLVKSVCAFTQVPFPPIDEA